jgi:hypothetical protein
MADEKITGFDIPYVEFEEWAHKQGWICVYQREQDFGDKTSSYHASDTTLIGRTYTYLTPVGMKVEVMVESLKVRSVSVNPNSAGNL